MKKHAVLIKPKFDIVISILEAQLGGKSLASWTNPKGGYFISLDTNNGCAKRVVQLASEAGVPDGVFNVLPGLTSLTLSFFDFSGFETSLFKKFVGFDNFVKIYEDKYFWIALKNTFLLVFGAVFIQT